MKRDRWAEWLAERRFGGDEAVRREFMAELKKWRDGVLDRARLQKHETLLDVGSGDGLIAFGALERGAGEVVFTDISQDLLDECRRIATDLGVVDPCRFVLAPADDLSALEDESVDVVTTRSVLVYVRAKDRALAEFLRVLRPGGRISLFEPINRLYGGFRDSYDLTPVSQETEKVWALYDQLQPRASDPMLDFDERDLVELAERVGFREVHLELRVDAIPATPRPWDVAARIAGNPNIPTLEEAIAETLTAEEAARFVAHLRPLVEEGRGRLRLAYAYLWAVK